MIKTNFLILVLAGALSISSHAQFEAFAAKYDLLTTIAGAGQMDDRGSSGWNESFEGGSAIEAELSRPHFAMADRHGNIYIADKEGHAIRKVDPAGIITTVAGTNSAGDNGDGRAVDCQLSSPNGVWVKADGTFFILDLGNSKIRRVDTEGNMLTLVDDPGGISLGRGLWVSQDEKLIYYVSGSRIKKWTGTGGIEIYAEGFASPGHIIVDPSGKLVVSDRGANRVYRLSDDGSKLSIAGNGSASGGGSGFQARETGLDGVRGVWFMEDQSYLLATHEGSQIWYVDSAGVINLFLDGRDGDEYHSGDGEHFQTPGYKISEARGVSVDYDGNIIITENDLGFIRKIERKESTSVELIHDLKPAFNVQVYPNPVLVSASISYELNMPDQVKLTVYKHTGQEVSVLVDQLQMAGVHSVTFNACKQGSGIYIYSLSVGSHEQQGQFLQLK